MLIHDYFRSSAAYRLRIALNLKGLSPERHFVHLRHGQQRAPDFLAVNPQGFVPALVDGDGPAIAQSLAIIEYLEETHPQPPLLPSDPRGRARVRQIALAIACDIHPLNNLRVLAYLTDPLGHDQETRDTWYRHWVMEGFKAIEALLAEPASGQFCHGDAPTLADICLIPQIANARRFAVDMEPYPIMRRIEDACTQIEAFAAARPDRQPDAE